MVLPLSMWVKWVHEERLRGKSIWEAEAYANVSWSWRTLLKLRNYIEKHVFHKRGNERTASLWHDI